MSAVLQTEQAQFDRIEHALRFAFATNRENIQGPILNRMAGGPGSEGRGLGGLEGAALAGMIRRQVFSLGEEGEAILRARYVQREEPCSHCKNGTTYTKQFEDATLAVMPFVASAVSGLSHYRLRHAVVCRHFSAKVRLGDVINKCQIPERTAGDHIAKIKAYLQKKEGAFLHAISANLRQAGILSDETNA
jgi:hypothetical protein